MEFKEKIQLLRTGKGLSQQELADTVFVSRSAVAKWESGRGIPDKINLESLCTFFEVSADELLSQEERDDFRARMISKYISVASIIFMVILTLPMTWHPDPEYLHAAVVEPPIVAFRLAGFFGIFAMLYFTAIFVFSLLVVSVPKIRFSRANNPKILLAILVATVLIFIVVLLYASYTATAKWNYNWFFIPQYQ